jgi:protein-S-isoprenylcysteine O-methyltransferase Ste14
MTEPDRPKILVFPPLAMLVALVAAIALEWLWPLHLLPPPFPLRTTLPGVVLTLASLALAVSGLRTFRRSGTNVDPRRPALKVIEAGPYRFTRNPMYLGIVGIQLGLALTFSLDWALFGAVLLGLVLHFGVVLREEEYMTAKFGAAYTEFRARTRRWL